MVGEKKMKKIAMIISPVGFQDMEFSVPKQFFESQGINVDVYSTQTGYAHGSLGLRFKVEHALPSVDVEAYDAIVFIGGPGTPLLRKNEYAVYIAKTAAQSGKIVAAICWSPTILAKAGVLRGKKATVWNGDDPEFKMTTVQYLAHHGATYTGEPLTVDGNILTANGPSAAKKFAEAIVNALK